VGLVKKNSDAFDEFQTIKAIVEESRRSVKILQVNNRGEFCSIKFAKLL